MEIFLDIKVGLKCLKRCLYKSKPEGEETDLKGEGNVTIKAMTGVMWLQAKECQEPKMLEEANSSCPQPPPRLFRECGSAESLILAQ